MESLIKKNNLMVIKVPKSFVDEFDTWRDEKSKKNNTPISRTIGFSLLGHSLRDLDVEMKIKKNDKKKICTLLFNTNARRNR